MHKLSPAGRWHGATSALHHPRPDHIKPPEKVQTPPGSLGAYMDDIDMHFTHITEESVQVRPDRVDELKL